MRGAGGAMAVAVAAMLVCCSAEPHQEQDVSPGEHSSADRYDANGHKTRNLDPLGGGHLTRGVREAPRHLGLLPYLLPRHNAYAGIKKETWPVADLSSFYELHKRNFDEIDRSDLDTFIKKRNFDEIDQTSMPFPYAKRFYHVYGNYLDNPMELYRSNFDKKRLRPEYPMDEIDLSHFPIGSKRSMASDDDRDRRAGLYKKSRGIADFPMDEIDASYFPIGSRRSLAR